MTNPRSANGTAARNVVCSASANPAVTARWMGSGNAAICSWLPWVADPAGIWSAVTPAALSCAGCREAGG